MLYCLCVTSSCSSSSANCPSCALTGRTQLVYLPVHEKWSIGIKGRNYVAYLPQVGEMSCS